MSMQQTQLDPTKANKPTATPWWRRLFQPPSSLTNISDQRQAQLLFGLSLIFLFMAILAAIFGQTYYIFIILISATTIAVGFSRTRYYRLGSLSIILALTILTFVRTTESIDGPLYFLPYLFLLATILLPFRWAVAAILFNAFGLFLLPVFSQVDPTELFKFF